MNKKDWIGDSHSIYVTLGASNHTDKEREQDDFYATDPIAIDKLLLEYSLPQNIYECACGQGHLSTRLIDYGYNVTSTDLIDRGYGKSDVDFLKVQSLPSNCSCILTNPPYKYATEFVLHSLDLLPDNGVCAMFLKTTFLEGKKRYNLLFSQYPPRYMFQFIERIQCAKNAEFERMKAGGGSAVAYAWFVWEKGYKGNTIIKWI